MQISISTSTSLLNEAKATKYKGLRALIQLLTHLCTKDLVLNFYFIIFGVKPQVQHIISQNR